MFVGCVCVCVCAHARVYNTRLFMWKVTRLEALSAFFRDSVAAVRGIVAAYARLEKDWPCMHEQGIPRVLGGAVYKLVVSSSSFGRKEMLE